MMTRVPVELFSYFHNHMVKLGHVVGDTWHLFRSPKQYIKKHKGYAIDERALNHLHNGKVKHIIIKTKRKKYKTEIGQWFSLLKCKRINPLDQSHPAYNKSWQVVLPIEEMEDITA